MQVIRKVLSGIIVAAGLGLAAAMLLPVAFGYQRYVITSGSMTGTYDRGSIVFDKAVPVSDLDVGDVITYSPPADSGVHGLITHRIVSIKNQGKDGFSYRTKGDANRHPDPWRFQLNGPTQARVAFAIPYIGYGIAALSVLPIRMILIGLPALLIAIGLIVRLWRQAGEEADANLEAYLAQQPGAAGADRPVTPSPVAAAETPAPTLTAPPPSPS